MEGRALVLYKRENNILAEELGSYEVETGLQFITKAYVENDICYIYLSTDRDVTDEQYNEIFDLYDMELFENFGFEIEEVEEYNPTWLIKFEFKDDYDYMEDKLNLIASHHEMQINEIYKN
ncbi:DUF6762 family protein [Caloramator sp. Dgby_cultured_2]|uniref:DUF6762 family protein n=1 Tax=Caloramator sp. Dgby_cultured_2 TaxID=3029174 RepID=UPI00237EE71D|nr:DUF6762 family protein [Caloramator sp. Dgby_cultured_2]WDU83739.1 hypothetical protein PWK10_04040 [Caloramator sp. Dgby_cultured_2]